jgi:hypothetical protein
VRAPPFDKLRQAQKGADPSSACLSLSKAGAGNQDIARNPR